MKKILIPILAVITALSLTIVLTDNSSADPDSGECGENLTWAYDSDSATLTISGEGTTIQDYASKGAPWHDLNVTNVVFDCPNLTTIGAYAFEDSNMSNHKLPYKITTINEGAFRNCIMLSLEKLPDKLTTIGNGAFEHCVRLNIITTPNNLREIGPNVFKDCMGIHMMIIPPRVTSIDDTSFEDTTGLTTVGNLSTVDITGKFPYMVSEIHPTIESQLESRYYNYGYYFDEIKLLYFSNTQVNPSSYTVPYPSEWNDYIASIKIGVVNYSSDIPLGSNMFRGCANMDKVYLPDSLGSPSTIVAPIPSSCFQGCTNLQLDELPVNTKSISTRAFDNCTSLALTELPDTVESISDYAFNSCTNLNLTELPSSLTSIGRYAFSHSGIPIAEIPSNTTTISDYSFEYCNNLVSLYIPSQVTKIGSSAFRGCGNLHTFEYNAINSTNGVNIFMSTPLNTVIIGEDVTSLNQSLFALSTISTVYFNAKNCNDFVTSTGTNIQVFGLNIPTYIIGDTVEYIPAYFVKGMRLTSISFGDNIKSIGDHAFENCSRMVVLSIPESVESIGTSAFAGCSNVMIRSLPEGVHLNPTAFQNCTGITSLILPGEIGFGPNCFEGCTNLKQILNLSDMEIVAGSDNHGKVGYYADSVQDHIDGIAIVQDKEHVQHETVMDDSLTSKLLRFVPVFVSLGLLLGAIAYMYVRRNDY